MGTVPAQRTPPIDLLTNRESALSRPNVTSSINTAANPKQSTTHNGNEARAPISFSRQSDFGEKTKDSFGNCDISVTSEMISLLALPNQSKSNGLNNHVKLSATSPSEQPKLKVRDFAKGLNMNQPTEKTDKTPLKRKFDSIDKQTTAEKQIQLSYVIGNDFISETVKLPSMPYLEYSNDAVGNPEPNDRNHAKSQVGGNDESLVPAAKKVPVEANDDLLPEEIVQFVEESLPDKESSLDESMMDSGVESETALSPKDSCNATVSVSSASPNDDDDKSTEMQTETPPTPNEPSEQPIENLTQKENNLLLDIMDKMSEDSDCDRLVIDEEPCADFGDFV